MCAADGPTENLRYENQEHGSAKLANRLDAYPMIAALPERHLTRDLT
jgi:hypothetical protein